LGKGRKEDGEVRMLGQGYGTPKKVKVGEECLYKLIKPPSTRGNEAPNKEPSRINYHSKKPFEGRRDETFCGKKGLKGRSDWQKSLQITSDASTETAEASSSKNQRTCLGEGGVD